MAAPESPRVLNAAEKLVLAALSSVLGGIGGFVCGATGAMLVLRISGVAGAIAAGVLGLGGGGACALSLCTSYLRTGWQAAARQMRAWFGLIALVTFGAEAVVIGVARWRRLDLPESAPLVTAGLLLCLPLLGALGAAVWSIPLTPGRQDVARVRVEWR